MHNPFIRTSPARYVSIDGGTSTVGFCYFGVSEDGNQLIIEHTKLLNVSRTDTQYEYACIRHGELTTRLTRLEHQLMDEVGNLPTSPDVVFYESHFINPRRPTSVIPLARFMQVVEWTLMQQGIGMEYIAPQQMKKTIQVTGKLAKADKDAIRKAIQRYIDAGRIVLPTDISLSDLSEHEVDSIGIGYTGLVLSNLIK